MSCFAAIFAFCAIICTVSAGPGVVPVTQVLAAQEAPRPYEFGYEFGDGFGMTQHRREVADGTGVVKGNYGYVDPLGLYRRVEYTADADGYKAIVHSNEPGMANQNVADAVYVVELPPAEVIQQGLRAAKPFITM